MFCLWYFQLILIFYYSINYFTIPPKDPKPKPGPNLVTILDREGVQGGKRHRGDVEGNVNSLGLKNYYSISVDRLAAVSHIYPSAAQMHRELCPELLQTVKWRCC